MPSWLPGMRITADRITVSSAQTEDTTPGRTTASTTYTDASGGAFSASVVVPMSGTVMVSIRSTQRNSATNINTVTSWQGVGSVSGTVYSPNDNAALIWAGGGTTNLSLGLRYRLSGLVPGETITVTTKHRVSGASTATFDHRSIQLEGAPA
ncbi:hypothetical protein [Streptomyces acidiscabies]|uniref:Uncharacterized protein n=1 Tax=Streptomyces acidiscabies TaxID=42234 RepID=A0AAP6ELB0_9ACTN|nr:hypothetical protein [Streptomyces acidiscabies]MBZ3918206.1 hypothetical protein [Streptomyces acidiscabies]MDX2967112.1 hypothetical protein [Streptomyces acidiscabies]MDX3788365.1 hypothetical protein [Streptomyces acidiscabies]